MAEPQRSLGSCCLAEFIGTFILVFFGLGAVHSAVLANGLTGLWQVGIVWGVAIMVAIKIVGGVSGAHINPAITFGLAVWRFFPWGRVGPYIGSQVLGAFVAAALLFTMYNGYLKVKEDAKGVVRGQPGSEITAMCYGEYFPNPGALGAGDTPYTAAEHAALNELVSEPIACFVEILGTAILAMIVAATADVRNPMIPPRLASVFIGLTVAALICVIAPLTQACFNPARDFGPRLFAFLAGWGSVALPGRGTGFLTVYILSPMAGAALGVGAYWKLVAPVFVGDPQHKGPAE